MKIISLLCVLLCVLCFATVQASAADRFRAIKLVGDLNDTAQSNEKARKEFMALRENAVTVLLEEIQKYKSLDNKELLSAARCFRVLRQMRSSRGFDLAAEVAAAFSPDQTKPGLMSRVLLSEALYYVSDNLSNEKARRIFFRFVDKSPEKWRSPHGFLFYSKSYGTSNMLRKANPWVTRRTYSWVGPLGGRPPAPMGYKRRQGSVEYKHTAGPGLTVDIYYGLRKLVEAKDPSAPKYLRALLQSAPFENSLFFEKLADDGFTPQTLLYTSEPGAESKVNWWHEPKGRPRILLMQWAQSIGAKEVQPEIEALLRSDQKVERDLALVILEAWND